MTKTAIRSLKDRIHELEPAPVKAGDESDAYQLKQAISRLSPDEQANMCRVIVALENKPPEQSYEQCIASLPEEQRAVIAKTEQILNTLNLPIEEQVALKRKELEKTPGAFDTGPDLSKSSAKARDRRCE